MASTSKLIADAIVSIIQALPGAPANVVWRKTEVWHPSGADGTTGICVSGGLDTQGEHLMDSSEMHEYAFQIAYFKPITPEVDGDDTLPSFFDLVKTALSVTTLPGVPVVWDYDIADRYEWEGQEFANGVEVSRCGVLYRTNEVP